MKIISNYIYLISVLILLFLVALKPIKEEAQAAVKMVPSQTIDENFILSSNILEGKSKNFSIDKKDQPSKPSSCCTKIPSRKDRFDKLSL